MKHGKLFTLVLSAFFAAIVFLGTYIIKIPIPNGYIHFGDGFIYIAAALLPLPASMAAAAVGGLLADLLAGYAVYAPCTAVIKLLMALAAGLVIRGSGDGRGAGRVYALVLAAALGGAVNVGGYFAADWALFGIPAAVSTVFMNCLQSLFGVAVFLILLPLFRKIIALSGRHR